MSFCDQTGTSLADRCPERWTDSTRVRCALVSWWCSLTGGAWPLVPLMTAGSGVWLGGQLGYSQFGSSGPDAVVRWLLVDGRACRAKIKDLVSVRKSFLVANSCFFFKGSKVYRTSLPPTEKRL